MLSKLKEVIHLPANQAIGKSENTSPCCLQHDLAIILGQTSTCGDHEVGLIKGALPVQLDMSLVSRG